MTNARNLVNVHRFRDELGLGACDHSEGATVYLSLKQAKELRAAIGRIIRAIESDNPSPMGLSKSINVRDVRYSKASKIVRGAL